MKTITVEYLNSGWSDPKFENKLKDLICRAEASGFEYYDIKISSSGNHSMVIFSRQ